MHELGLVFHIIKAVGETAEENGVSKVSRVTVQIGEVSGVIPEYLIDCWNWAVKREGRVMNEAKLLWEPLPAVTHCDNCGENYPTVEYAKICPHCGSDKTWLLTGNEFSIKEIEVPDE